MKKVLKFLCMYLLLSLFVNCQKDDSQIQENPVNKKSGTINTRLITGQEALELQQEVVAHIGAGDDNTKSINAGRDITVLEDEVLEFKDQYGNTHYTYRALHANPGNNTFYNVVMTEDTGFKQTMLIEYAMTQKFTEQYTLDGNIDNFEGIITFTPITTDSGFPCDETPNNPITVSPGGVSGGGGGTGGGNGGGIPGSGGGGNGNGYTYNPVIAYISLQFRSNEDDEPWVLVHRSSRNLSVEPTNPSLTPCGDAQIGILLPLIMNNIDKPCQKEIINDILDTSSPFTDIIQQTFNTNDNVNLRISNTNLPQGNAATSPVPFGSPDNYTINIKFDNSYLNTATDLSIVTSLLHELIHAYLIDLYLKDQLIATNQDYTNLLSAFIGFYKDSNQVTFTGLDNEIHNAMADFMQKMATSIYNYAQSKGMTNVDMNYCAALAWSSMQDTDLYNEVLTPQQKYNYSQIGYNEQENTGRKKGTKCP